MPQRPCHRGQVLSPTHALSATATATREKGVSGARGEGGIIHPLKKRPSPFNRHKHSSIVLSHMLERIRWARVPWAAVATGRSRWGCLIAEPAGVEEEGESSVRSEPQLNPAASLWMLELDRLRWRECFRARENCRWRSVGIGPALLRTMPPRSPASMGPRGLVGLRSLVNGGCVKGKQDVALGDDVEELAGFLEQVAVSRAWQGP